MASKLANLTAIEGDCKTDNSSMIDMVFQLILFFMVSSRLLTNQIDPKVEIPVADHARPPEQAAGRIVVNIYDDGSFSDVERKPLADDAAISDYVLKMRNLMPAGVTPKVLLRGHRNTLVKYSKQVIKAAGEVGVNTIIFSAYPNAKKYGGAAG